MSRLGLSVFVLATCLRAAPWDYEGKLIGALRFDPPLQPLSAAQLSLIVDMQPGDPLTATNVRRAIQRLYATGRYDELQVDAILREDRVTVTFFTKQNWFISRISVEGAADPPNREQLVGATKLELGSKYTEAKLADAIEGLRANLQANGFYTPRIQPLVERYPAYDELHIQFLVNPGERAYFARPNITGDLKMSPSDIIGASNWERWWGLLGWKAITEGRVTQGIERIRRSYIKKDFLLAKVELQSLDRNPVANTVSPQLLINAGPLVSVNTTGTRLSKGRLRDLVPIYQEQSVDQDLLEEGSRKITEYFQARGFFDADVSYETSQPSPDEQQIEYFIDRGQRHKLTSVEIRGNQYFDTLTIRERMSIFPAGRFFNRAGRFSEDLLARDRNAIAELYRSNGFRDVTVTSEVQRRPAGKDRDVAVVVNIEEGPQYFVNSLEVSGVDLRIYPYIQELLTSTEGQPYSAFNLALDRDNVLNFYYNNGYPDASLDISSQPSDNPQRMEVRLVVTEGRRLFVGDVVVNGLTATRPNLVFSRISLQQGEPLSLSRMVYSQRRLYDLGIFAKVDMALENPDGSVREKRVLYQFEEASRWSFNAGLGAEFGQIGGSVTSLSSPAGANAFAPRVSLGVSRLNFLGIGHTVGVQTRVSTLQRRGIVTYLAPQFQGRENLNLTVTALFDDSRNVRTFSSRRFEGAVQLGQRFSRAFAAQYRFVTRQVSARDVKIEPGLIPLFSQPVRVGLISTTLINDRRDDPLNATRGYYTSIDMALASGYVGSQTDFFRTLARNSSFHRVSRDLVLSRNTTFGWIGRRGDAEIPLPERFFAGGAVSHRGFPENQAGPRDLLTGFPVGGRALLFNQTELRFPLLGDKLGGVLFHDSGNVYSRLDNISLRYAQRNLTDFDYMVHAVGFGLRYRTPIGPVRIDLAYAMNTPRFDGYRGSINDLVNNLGQRVTQKVRAFQFHFSLGQAF
ncbi:MAG: BamA/TamA family outer membrane protein [Bryobacterales bacterium]|nr:BamA/TamA family outer membrane protein [Bryobacterales bacterium]